MVCANASYTRVWSGDASGTTGSDADDARDTMSVTTWVCVVVTPLLVLVGVLGNGVSLLVFGKRAQRSASHFYFCTLVVADSLTLVFSFLVEAWLRQYLKEGLLYLLPGNLSESSSGDWLSDGGTQVEAWQEQTGDGSYRLFCLPSVFMRTAAQTASVYLLITFTATRTLVIVRPLQSAVWATVYNAKKCVAVVAAASGAVACLVTLHHAAANLCDSLVASDVLDFVFLSLVPSVVLLVLNCIMLGTIYRRERSTATFLRPHVPSLHVGGITRRLLIVTAAFVLLEVPFAVYKLYIHVHALECQPHGHVHRDAERALRLLSNVNYSINFLLYCLSGPQFRRAISTKLCCYKPSQLTNRHSTHSRRSTRPRRSETRRTEAASCSSTHGTIKGFRSVAAWRANLVTLQDELELEMLELRDDHEVECFKLALESELQDLCVSSAVLLRSVSLPSFVHLSLETQHKVYSIRKSSASVRHRSAASSNANANNSARLLPPVKTRQRSHSMSCGTYSPPPGQVVSRFNTIAAAAAAAASKAPNRRTVHL